MRVQFTVDGKELMEVHSENPVIPRKGEFVFNYDDELYKVKKVFHWFVEKNHINKPDYYIEVDIVKV